MNWIDVKTHAAKPLSWWFNEFRRGRINMSPGYQRRSNLWGKWKKAHLIDSVINGFDIPKFYVADFDFAENQLRDNKSRFAVIDGKQRFEALFQFLLGELALNPSSKYAVEPNAKIGGLKIDELRTQFPSMVKRLEEFQPVVMSVATNTPGMVEELFIRLNSGVSINGAERRNAMPGPVPPIVRDVTVHPFFGENIGFSTDRMQEFNLAAKLLMFEFEGGFSETKARNLDAFVNEAHKAVSNVAEELELANSLGQRTRARKLQRQYDELLVPYRSAEQAVLENLDVMSEIFQARDFLLARQGAIPVYYWVIRNNPRLKRKIREFLAELETSVLQNVRKARITPDEADSELLAYYSAQRTSNDKSSMQDRYNIILSRFEKWRRKK